MPEEGSIGLLKGYEEVDMHIWTVRPTVRVGRSAPVDGNKLTHNLKSGYRKDRFCGTVGDMKLFFQKLRWL